VAWCPTPSAQRALRKAGATLAAAPAAACLQRVNHRRFSAQLGQTLPAALFTDQLSRALNVLQQPLPNGWVVKRAFGFAGRAVRRFGSHPTKDDVRWLEDGVRLGGVQLEPWQDILHEYSLHGYIDSAFNVKLGQPCVLLEPTLPSYERVDRQLPGPRSSLGLLPTERHQLFCETERV